MFQSTRLKLALWYTAITAILLLIFATGIYFYVRHTLIDRVDDTLKHVVEVVKKSLIVQPINLADNLYKVNIEASFLGNVNAVEEDHIDLEWFNPEKELIWSTFSEPLNIKLQLNPPQKTVTYGSNYLLRQVTEKIQIGDRILGYLRVSHPWFEVTKPIRQLIFDLSFWVIIMLISVAFIGWFLSGIAIKPVIDSYQSLKQFTADASHELRNPIATIQTNVQMALTYPEMSQELQEKQLRIIERLTKKLGHLVNDLLFLARADSGIVKTDFQTVPLDALLMEVIEEQRAIAEQKNIILSLSILTKEIEKETEDEIFNVKGDWEQLSRLFTNLISNSITYTNINNSDSEGLSVGKVTVELKLIKINRQSKLKVTIKDNGIGISATALPYIFDRFYRVDPARSNQAKNPTGTGLGLAIAKAIVENHQGQIKVSSQVCQGTTFEVYLPALIAVKT